MTVSAELSTIGGDIQCHLITQRKVVDFRLTVIEAMGLSNALFEYANKVLHAHASKDVSEMRAMLSSLPPVEHGARQ